MLLNDFLGFRLGVDVEKKYNFPVIKEVLENSTKYPAIYTYISEGVDYDVNDKVIKKDYDFGFFDCDDIDCAGAVEALELNKAFNRVILRDVIKKKIKVKSMSFGVDYLMSPSISGVQDPYLNYRAISFITVTPTYKTIGMEVFNHKIIDGERYGHLSREETSKTYYEYNDEIFKDIEERIKIEAIDDYVEQSFDSKELERRETEINGQKCYSFDCYCFEIGNNYIKFYTTERGFEPLGGFRMLVVETLTDEQRENDIVKKMGLIY